MLKIGGAVTLVLSGVVYTTYSWMSKLLDGIKVTVQDVMVAGSIHEPVNIQISNEKLKLDYQKDLRVEGSN